MEELSNKEVVEQLAQLQEQLDLLQFRVVGQDLQKGFISAEDFYTRIGQYDYVINCTFVQGSLSYLKYGENITIIPQYTRRERNQLIENIQVGVNGNKDDIVKGIGLPGELSKEQQLLLSTDGIRIGDIEKVNFIPQNETCNLYSSSEQRHIHKLEVDLPYFEDKIGWLRTWLGFFNKRLTDGDILTPQEHKEFIALKLLFFGKDKCTTEEIEETFENENTLKDDVGRIYLEYRKEVGDLSEKQMNLLKECKRNVFAKRLEIVNSELKKLGKNIFELAKRNPDAAVLLFNKCFYFCEHRLNGYGKFPIYLDFKRFIHIYLRHVADFGLADFMKKDTFQLAEQDVISMMKIVVGKINEEYQTFREQNPNVKFSKYGAQEIYVNGDYYALHITPEGLLETLYKSTRSKRSES